MQEAERDSELRNEVAAHPLVRAVLEAFPGATVASVRDRIAAADPGVDAAEDETETEEDDFGDGGNAGEEA
jgi:DNA polymerase-3 subunit gamma/tau